jgi:hypothetical protein
MDKKEEEWKSILNLNNTQHAWLIFSISLTKEFTHLARHIPPSSLRTIHEKIINELLKSTSSKILCSKWNTDSWKQATLPIKRAGK